MREVVQGDHGLHVPLGARGEDRLVPVECGLVDLTRFGLDARPLDPQPEDVASHRSGPIEMLLVAVPESDRAPRRLDETGALPPHPVVRGLSRPVHPSLDLEGGGCDPEPEAVREDLTLLATLLATFPSALPSALPGASFALCFHATSIARARPRAETGAADAYDRPP